MRAVQKPAERESSRRGFLFIVKFKIHHHETWTTRFSQRRNRRKFKLQPTNQPTNSLSLLDAGKQLGRRECEVLDLMAEGKSSHEIANDLHISKSTVDNHITTIGKVLNLSGRGKVRKWLMNEITK